MTLTWEQFLEERKAEFRKDALQALVASGVDADVVEHLSHDAAFLDSIVPIKTLGGHILGACFCVEQREYLDMLEGKDET